MRPAFLSYMINYMPAEIAMSYYVKNRRKHSFLSSCDSPKQNGWNYAQKIMRQKGLCGAYITGNLFELSIVCPTGLKVCQYRETLC